MKVVGVLYGYPPSTRNGAVLTTARYLRALAERGHEVHAVQHLGMARPAREVDGVTLHVGAHLVADMVRSADVVVHHAGDIDRVKATADAAGVPRVVLEHGVNRPVDALRGCALSVHNTTVLAELAAELGGDGERMVIPPPFDVDDYRTEPGDRVTLVNLSRPKGVHTVWRVAERLPDIPFLGVKGGYGQQHVPRASNFEVRRTTRDMRSVYGSTRVLCMPSDQESYGRVAAEAMVSGIPVVAHPSPGPVSAFGDAVTWVDRNDIDGWVEAVGRLMTDDEAWRAASRVASTWAESLDPAGDLERFCVAVERIGGAPKAAPAAAVRDEAPEAAPAAAVPDGAPGFAVVGTGRCGTGYTSKLLADAGGLNVGHEKYWRPRGRKKLGLDGDVSWLALPAIEAADWAGPVVHVVRNPVDVVRSLVGIGFFAGTDKRDRNGWFRGFALKHEPELANMDPLTAAVEWWARWNARCAAVADLTVKVEELADRLGDVFGVIGHPVRNEDAYMPFDVNKIGRAHV